ncbi:hypothetical protein QFC22_006568 [Naganishia vaughanmartiniae]|uniref:Uncharacterized protein n=1 Tax=Naganishia vaughanmartiniae TaxID=1424756 RepID=A0ACC2WIG6_9TREE|nr:hypothetical protein QFC22_006568 [Naganishia vaughanmartiniae]
MTIEEGFVPWVRSPHRCQCRLLQQAVLGRSVDPGALPDLPSTLFQLAATSSPLHRISVYNLLLSNPDIITLSSLASQSAPPQAGSVGIRTVLQVLTGGMDDPIPEVRLEAVKAAAQVIVVGEEYGKLARSERVKVGAGLVGKITQILPSFPTAQVVPAIEALTTIAESQPSAFAPQTTNTTQSSRLVPFLLERCCLPQALERTLPSFLQTSSFAPMLHNAHVNQNSSAEPGVEETFSDGYTRFSASLNLLITLSQSQATSPGAHPSALLHARELVPLLLAWLAVGISPYPIGSEGEKHVVEAWLERDDTEEEDDEVTEMQEYGLEAFASLLRK